MAQSQFGQHLGQGVGVQSSDKWGPCQAWLQAEAPRECGEVEAPDCCCPLASVAEPSVPVEGNAWDRSTIIVWTGSNWNRNRVSHRLDLTSTQMT